MIPFTSKKKESNESVGSNEDKVQPQEGVAGLRPSNDSGGSGLFGALKKTATANVTTRKSRRKPDKTLSSLPPADTTMQRKIVKAKQPPESSGEDLNPPSDAADGVEDKNMNRDAKRFALPGNAPSVEEETQKELFEKTKKGRQVAAASAKKEKKEKELDEKRKSAASGDRSADTEQREVKDDATGTKEQKDAIFSVQSERAEQKRTVGKASLPVDPEPVEKRMKMGTSGDEPEVDKNGGTKDAKDAAGAKSWMGFIAVAAVVAVGAFVLTRAIKKK